VKASFEALLLLVLKHPAEANRTLQVTPVVERALPVELRLWNVLEVVQKKLLSLASHLTIKRILDSNIAKASVKIEKGRVEEYELSCIRLCKAKEAVRIRVGMIDAEARLTCQIIPWCLIRTAVVLSRLASSSALLELAAFSLLKLRALVFVASFEQGPLVNSLVAAEDLGFFGCWH
jgi:hypothetical protein